jgi:hypothetical protein
VTHNESSISSLVQGKSKLTRGFHLNSASLDEELTKAKPAFELYEEGNTKLTHSGNDQSRVLGIISQRMLHGQKASFE